MILGAGHPFARRQGIAGTHFVGCDFFQQVVAAPQRAYMRSVEFVHRADQEITAQRLHVERDMRGQVHGIDENQCAGIMRFFHDCFYRIDGSHSVRSATNRHQLGAFVEQAIQFIHA